MTTVRIGASMAKNVQDVLDWLHINVGEFHRRHSNSSYTTTHYHGEGWLAAWRQFGGGWFMDITFDDPKHATFFTLRWK